MSMGFNLRAGTLAKRGTPRRPRRWATVRLAAIAAAISLAPMSSPALAAHPVHPAYGDTSVFATLPYPGHPFGVAVDRDRVYVSTSRGDFFANQPNSDGERVFAYTFGGKLVNTTSIATMPDATMGLWGVALDGNPKPTHKLYVADMNGRILRISLDHNPVPPEVFATPPPEFAGGWMTTMWNDLVFDPAGNLYMTDDKPRIWRVTPDGQASVWFSDDAIAGYFGFAGGPLGGRIDPTGKWFYFTITISAVYPLEAAVYRLPLVEHPLASDLELVHRFPVMPNQPLPQASGLTFSKAGNIYVGLIGPNQIAVLDPAGNEVRRISSPLFDSPWGLAWLGQSLLVTNADIQPVESPDKWSVLKVFVGETGLPLNRPRTSGGEGN
jgi:sugar lactone lactonase YvrE